MCVTDTCYLPSGCALRIYKITIKPCWFLQLYVLKCNNPRIHHRLCTSNQAITTHQNQLLCHLLKGHPLEGKQIDPSVISYSDSFIEACKTQSKWKKGSKIHIHWTMQSPDSVKILSCDLPLLVLLNSPCPTGYKM